MVEDRHSSRETPGAAPSPSPSSVEAVDSRLPSGWNAQLTRSGDSATAPATQAAGRFIAGDLLAGRFRVVRYIAKGGMGEVYEAEDLELHERVALKTVLPVIARNPDAIERFKREIQLARKITHPNVCRIFDLFRHSSGDTSETFLSMELLTGETLARRLARNGKLSTQEFQPIVEQVALGLQAAHRAGIIHQDLKAGNIMLVPEQNGRLRAVITDFGLARRIADGSTGPSGGTPVYMAPEQVRNEAVSPRTDIYALGVVMYEALTVHWPFQGTTWEEVVQKRLDEAPTPPTRYVPHLPLDWERVILRCLARESSERFADATAVIEALRRPSRARWPWVAAAVFFVVCCLAGGYEWRTVHLRRPAVAVAVVGMRNESANPKYDWLATELTETLTADLATAKRLCAVPADEVAQARNEIALTRTGNVEDMDSGELRQATGANFLILARYSVQPDGGGDRLVLNARILGPQGEIVGNYHAAGAESAYEAVVADVAARIRLALGDVRPATAETQEISRIFPSDEDARRDYFNALTRLRAFDGRGALDLLKQAAAREDNSPTIHATMASAWSMLRHDADAAAEANRAAVLADKADLPREFVVMTDARAAEMSRDWTSAIELYRSLYTLNPSRLDYGLQLAQAEIGGSRANDALAVTAALAKLPQPLGGDPRIELANAKAFEALGDFKSELQAAQFSLHSARSRQARLLEANADLQSCWAYRSLGQVDQAIASCDDAQKIFTVFGDNVSAGVALNNVANWLGDRGRYAEAKDAYDRVLDITQAAGSERDTAGALLNAARMLIFLGKLDDASSYLGRSIELSHRIHDTGDEAKAHIALGEVYRAGGSLADAQREAKRGGELAQQLHDPSTQAFAIANLALYNFISGDLAEASASYAKALKLRQVIGDKSGVAAVLNGLGDVFFARGDLAAAETQDNEALQLEKALQEPAETQQTMVALAEIALQRQEFEKAHQMVEGAIEEFRGEGDTDSEAYATALAIRILVTAHRAAEADAYVTRLRQITVKDRDMQFPVAIALAEYAAATGKQQDALNALSAIAKDATRSDRTYTAIDAGLLAAQIQGGKESSVKVSELRAAANHYGYQVLAHRADQLMKR